MMVLFGVTCPDWIPLLSAGAFFYFPIQSDSSNCYLTGAAACGVKTTLCQRAKLVTLSASFFIRFT